MFGACTATSSIILPNDNELIVERNIHSKPEDAFPKREISKFSSATALISVILASRTCYYVDYRSDLRLNSYICSNIKQQYQIYAEQPWIQTPNNLGHIIWASFSHSYYIKKVGVIKGPGFGWGCRYPLYIAGLPFWEISIFGKVPAKICETENDTYSLTHQE